MHGATVIVRPAFVDAIAESVTMAVNMNVPTVLGIPLMTPEELHGEAWYAAFSRPHVRLLPSSGCQLEGVTAFPQFPAAKR